MNYGFIFDLSIFQSLLTYALPSDVFCKPYPPDINFAARAVAAGFSLHICYLKSWQACIASQHEKYFLITLFSYMMEGGERPE